MFNPYSDIAFVLPFFDIYSVTLEDLEKATPVKVYRYREMRHVRRCRTLISAMNCRKEEEEHENSSIITRLHDTFAGKQLDNHQMIEVKLECGEIIFAKFSDWTIYISREAIKDPNEYSWEK